MLFKQMFYNIKMSENINYKNDDCKNDKYECSFVKEILKIFQALIII